MSCIDILSFNSRMQIRIKHFDLFLRLAQNSCNCCLLVDNQEFFLYGFFTLRDVCLHRYLLAVAGVEGRRVNRTMG